VDSLVKTSPVIIELAIAVVDTGWLRGIGIPLSLAAVTLQYAADLVILDPKMFGLGKPKVRTGQGSTRLTREEFARRFKEHFYDPAFDSAQSEIEHLLQIA
jgi:hypothetical protein